MAKAIAAIGATSALMVSGLAFVAVSPASAAAGTHLVFTTTPASGTAGVALSNIVVTVEDGGGNPATGTGASDTIALTSSCTINSGTTTQTASSAVATFTGIIIDTAGSCTLTATDTLAPDDTFTPVVSAAIPIAANTANKIAYTTGPPTAATIGVSLTTFKVSVEDSHGNVITTGVGALDTVAIATSSAGCTLAGTDTVTAAAGVATFGAVSFSAGTSCTLTATDTLSPDNAFTAVTSGAINVVSNTPTGLGFTTEPATSVAASTVLPSFAVSVEASNGVALSGGVGAADVIVLTSACALTGTTSVAAINDVATFTGVTIKTGSTCQLVATDSTRTLAIATSRVILVTAGAATQVVFTTAPPTTETTPSTILATFRASVEDANGNVVTTGTGSSDTIAITSTCTLGGTTTAAAVAGVATFSALSINATGACVLTATDSSRTLTVATHTTSVGTPQAAVTVRTLKGAAGTALRLSISGGTGTGAVTWTLAAGSSAGCTLSGNSLTARRAGACTVTATKAGDTTYIGASSPATKVTFVLPFKAYRVIGALFSGRTTTATITGSGFYGRPKVISNVSGISTRVIRDTGRTLVVVIFVGGGVRPGVHAFTILLANGKRTSVRYSLR